MAMYWTCPLCGANLDPGESCDCQEENNNNKSKEENTNGSSGDN